MQFKDGDLAIGFYSRTPYIVVNSIPDPKGMIVVSINDPHSMTYKRYSLMHPDDMVHVDPREEVEIDLADEIQVIKDRLDDIEKYLRTITLL